MSVYAAFADLLMYPRSDPRALVERCRAGLGRSSRGEEAERLLSEFEDAARRVGITGLEEAYTVGFDLAPSGTLYVGHHVFGENMRRSLFLCRLVELYRESGADCAGGELPDHLTSILRYLDGGKGGTAREELVADAVIPALSHIVSSLESGGNPYAPAVRALQAVLAETAPPAVADVVRASRPAEGRGIVA